MRIGMSRFLLVAAFGLALSGCETSNDLANLFKSDKPGSEAMAAAPADDVTGSLPPPRDDVSLAKAQYRAGNFTAAEASFRHAAERNPRDADAWLGVAAACDRLHRFDCADRGYAEALGILGPTVEVLNNQGYSFMLRGDYKRAHEALEAARRKDPSNQYVQNNLKLLRVSVGKKTAVN